MENISLYLSRILSGYNIINFNNSHFKVVYPSIVIKYQAELYAEKEYEKNKFNDWIKDDDLVTWMIDMGIWNWDGDHYLKKIEENIDNLKVDLYKNLLRPSEQKRIRKQLITQKSLLSSRTQLRHSFDHVTLSGYVENLKSQYLLIHSIYTLNNELLFSNFENADSTIIHNISCIINDYNIDMTTFRKIARNDVWRNYWSANKNNVFNKSGVEMTDEQKTLVVLTRMYDGAHEHPECPPDNVFEDDDMFDGWLIYQRKEMEKSRNKNRNDKLLENKKLGNAQEVFVMANNKEEATTIYDLNDDTHKHIIQERDKYIQKNNTVKDSELPDVKRDIQIQVNESLTSKTKKR
jgi:transcriptional regulator of NAD metabolism